MLVPCANVDSGYDSAKIKVGSLILRVHQHTEEFFCDYNNERVIRRAASHEVVFYSALLVLDTECSGDIIKSRSCFTGTIHIERFGEIYVI